MPLMYLLGAIHCILGYLSYKFLIVDFFRKSFNFTEEIPYYALSMMKYGLMIHMLMILFMYTNKRLLTPAGYTREEHYRPPN